jgi:hypothetical protein
MLSDQSVSWWGRTRPYAFGLAVLVAVLFRLASIGLASDEETGRLLEAPDPNAGFELGCYGAPCGWSPLTPFGLVTAASSPRSGTYSAALTLTRGNSGMMISRCMQLTPGATYALEYWYNAGSFQLDHLSSFVDFWHTPDCGAVVSSSLVGVSAPVGDNQWHKATGTVSVPADGSGAATIAFQAATSGREATVFIDDVSWADVP